MFQLISIPQKYYLFDELSLAETVCLRSTQVFAIGRLDFVDCNHLRPLPGFPALGRIFFLALLFSSLPSSLYLSCDRLTLHPPSKLSSFLHIRSEYIFGAAERISKSYW